MWLNTRSPSRQKGLPFLCHRLTPMQTTRPSTEEPPWCSALGLVPGLGIILEPIYPAWNPVKIDQAERGCPISPLSTGGGVLHQGFPMGLPGNYGGAFPRMSHKGTHTCCLADVTGESCNSRVRLDGLKESRPTLHLPKQVKPSTLLPNIAQLKAKPQNGSSIGPVHPGLAPSSAFRRLVGQDLGAVRGARSPGERLSLRKGAPAVRRSLLEYSFWLSLGGKGPRGGGGGLGLGVNKN